MSLNSPGGDGLLGSLPMCTESTLKRHRSETCLSSPLSPVLKKIPPPPPLFPKPTAVDSDPNKSNDNVPQSGLNFSKDNNALYTRSCTGPFYVYLESTGAASSRLHPMSVGRRLRQVNAQGWDKIHSIGFSRVKIHFTTRDAANRLVNNSLLPELGLKAFIPRGLVQKRGVLRDVDIALTNEEILKYTRSNHPILEVRRMTRKSEGRIRPLPVVVLTFEGTVLPATITIDGVNTKVQPYVPSVLQCDKCLRFNHLAAQCRSNPRCGRCGGPHIITDCHDDTSKCGNCGGDHLATSRSCPSFLRAKKTKEVSVIQNISFSEARKLLDQSSTNDSPGYIPTPEHFPPLAHQETEVEPPHWPKPSRGPPPVKVRPQPTPRHFPHVDVNEAIRSRVPLNITSMAAYAKAFLESTPKADFVEFIRSISTTVGPLFNLDQTSIDVWVSRLTSIVNIVYNFLGISHG